MIRGWEIAMAAILVLVLLVPLSLGCGGGGGGGKVTITIGDVEDLTGPSASAAQWSHITTADMVRYWNDEGLIPGVKLNLVTWDERYDPSRDLPGYEWCKERGAKVIYSLEPSFSEAVKPFAERDRIVICSAAATKPQIEPPGWVFDFSATFAMDTKTILKWVSENDWDYSKGVPKLGFPGWNEPLEVDMDKAISEYVQDHQGKFDYVGAFLTPTGTANWAGQVEKLKNCDYIFWAGGLQAQFLKQFHDAGYTTRFISSMAAVAFRGFMVDLFGWEPPLDGMISTFASPWWGEGDSYAMVKLAEENLRRYHSSGQADEIIYRGGGSYVGSSQSMYAILEILKAAVEEVGARNFDGQAYYNAALKYELSGPVWKGYPQWGFSQTKRCWQDDEMIYRWSAEAKDLVRISDWIPVVIE